MYISIIQKSLALPMVLAMAYTAGAATESTPERERNNRILRRDTSLGQTLTDEFRRDPLFQYLTLSIDLYNGLAIVHGGAPNREMVDVVTRKLREREGVDAVYNYMVSPDEIPAPAASIAVTYDAFERMSDVGMDDNAFAIAGRVTQRLDADPALSGYEIDVDTYLGLVILHGTVGSPALMERAKEIARHTEGVKAVLSYVNTDIPAGPLAVREAPIVTRSIIVEPAIVEPAAIPVSVEKCCR